MKHIFKKSAFALATAGLCMSAAVQAQSSNINLGSGGTSATSGTSGVITLTAPNGTVVNGPLRVGQPSPPAVVTTMTMGGTDPSTDRIDTTSMPGRRIITTFNQIGSAQSSTSTVVNPGSVMATTDGSVALARGDTTRTTTTATWDLAHVVVQNIETGVVESERDLFGVRNADGSFTAYSNAGQMLSTSGVPLGALALAITAAPAVTPNVLGGNLNVSGNSTLTGTTASNGIANTGNIATDTISSTGNANVGGNLAVAGGTATNGINNLGALATTTLGTSGAGNIGGQLNVAGTTGTNGIGNTGNISNTGNIINGGAVNTATLATVGNAAVGGALRVAGAAGTNGISNTGNIVNSGAVSTATLATAGNAAIGGALSVVGATATNGITNTGAFRNDGNAVVNGSLVVGAVDSTTTTETLPGETGMALLPALSNNDNGTSTVYTVLNRNASTRTVTATVSGGTATFGSDGTLILSGGGSSTTTAVQTFDVARRVVVDNATGNVISVDPDPVQGLYTVGPDGVPMFVEGLPDAVVTTEDAVGQGGNLQMAGNAAIGGALSVAGAATTNGITNVGALATDTLSTSGAATVGGALSVAGAAATNGISNTGNIVNSGAVNTATLATTGNATVGGALSVAGAAATNGISNTGNIVNSGAVNTATLATSGNAAVGGALTVAGATTTNGLLTAAGGFASAAANGVGLQVNSSGVVASAGLASALTVSSSAASLRGNGAVVDLSGSHASISNSTGHGLFVSATETVISGGTSSTSATFGDDAVVFDRNGTGPARVTGIANGSQQFDAVNYGQLLDVREFLARGVASATAVANIPQVEAGKRFSFGGALGSYDSEVAFAIGGTVRVTSNSIIKASIGSAASGSKPTVGLGFAASW